MTREKRIGVLVQGTFIDPEEITVSELLDWIHTTF